MERHLWQIQPVRDALVLGAAFGLVWLGYRLSIVTVPILLALTLAYLFEPVVQRVTRRRRVTRPVAALSIIVLSAVAVVAPVTVGLVFGVIQGVQLVNRTAEKVGLLVESVQQPENDALRRRLGRPGDAGDAGGTTGDSAWQKIRDYIVSEGGLPALAAAANAGRGGAVPANGPAPGPTPDAPDPAEITPDVSPLAVAADGNSDRSDLYRAVSWIVTTAKVNASTISARVVAAGEDVLGGAFGFFGSIGRLAFTGFLTAFFFYFLCTGYGDVLRFGERLVPEARKARTFGLLEKMDAVIAGFVRGRITVCLVLTLVYTLGYLAIGVPAWLIMGAVTGLLTLVPYAAGASAPVAMLLMWLDPGGGWQGEWWWVIGGPLLILGIAQFLDDWVLTPLIQGKSTNMDTPSILFASIAGGTLAGVYGLLLAIPVAACIKILLTEIVWPRVRAWVQGRADDPLPIRKD